MIEREFVKQKIKEFQLEEYIKQNLKQIGHSKTLLKKTPLGEKIEIYAARPGIVVGKKGSSIIQLTEDLKKKFGFENPQVETIEVKDIFLDPAIVAETIANSLEHFGLARFKGIGHKAMENVMNAGAKGVEVMISGKVPSSRAKTWRFQAGYMKKCGDVATQIPTAYALAKLKIGIVGIQVRIMPPNLVLPDHLKVLDEPKEEIKEDLKKQNIKEEKKSKKKKVQDREIEKKENEKKEKIVKRAKKPREKKQKKEAKDQNEENKK